MEFSNKIVVDPFFSVCIPQYNRTSFILEVCKSLAAQTFRAFEVCISDDCSTDGRGDEIVSFLQQTGLSFHYKRRASNGRYDANLRASIELASGKYCFLLGNDDILADSTILDRIHREITACENIGAVITNYQDIGTAVVSKRVQRPGVVGSGPGVAAAQFRNSAFVSGVVLERAPCQAESTAKWDGVEFYQMYLASRIIASGKNLLALDLIAIRKSVLVPGETVDSYVPKRRTSPCSIVERPINVRDIGRLVADAITPYIPAQQREKYLRSIFGQILGFTYPYWIQEYRRVESWKYAVGICLTMRPRNILRGLNASAGTRASIAVMYGAATISGLIIPQTALTRLYPFLYRLAKRYGLRKTGNFRCQNAS